MAVVTPSELLERINGELARRSLREFIPQAWPIIEPATPFQSNYHIDAIAEHLEAVSHGEIRNLLINMPPRCMKSSIISVMWPAWEWTNNPSIQWLFSSYALQLAIRDALKSRRIIEHPWYQRNYGDIFQLSPDQNAKSRYENDKRGYRLSASVDSGVTGEGGDRVVVDDPHNVREMESPAVRAATLEWWDQAMSTRLNNPRNGCKVIVMQRLHEADLAGHVLAQGGYVHLNLPMEYEPSRHCVTAIGWEDPRREEGQLLWPERFGPNEVAHLKTTLGTYGYAGQCQQRPTPKAGGAFQRSWFTHRYRELPKMTKVVQSIDSAFKEGVSSDYTTIATWGTDGIDYYLIDIWRARVAFPELIQGIKDQYAKHRPRMVLIEDKASGQSAIQVIRTKTRIPVFACAANTSKENRADLVSPLFEAGKAYLPEQATWLSDWIDEHIHFPRAEHDDQVDTTSYALLYLDGRLHAGDALTNYLESREKLASQTDHLPIR